jgi:phospholipase/carboxylesterase
MVNITPPLQLADYTYTYLPGAEITSDVLLLLHGTGGDENDLVQLGRDMSPDAHIISPRGNVVQHGANRFFNRYDNGEFDYDDVAYRAAQLSTFLADAIIKHGITPTRVTILGYSNGANIAAAMILLRPDGIDDVVLLRSLYPLQDLPIQDLSTKRILMLNGTHDTIIPHDQTAKLASYLTASGAQLDFRLLPADHRLTNDDITIVRDWMSTI